MSKKGMTNEPGTPKKVYPENPEPGKPYDPSKDPVVVPQDDGVEVVEILDLDDLKSNQ